MTIPTLLRRHMRPTSNRLTRTGRTVAASLLAAGLALGATTAPAQEIKSSDVHPMGYPTTEAIKYFGELLSTWTDGRLSVKIYHSMQLGGEKEALE